MRELVVDRAAEDLRVAVLEVLVELAEGGDLGGADKREVLRVEEDHAPLASVRLVGDGLEVVLGLLSVDLAQVAALQSGELEVGKLVSDGEKCHVILLGLGRCGTDTLNYASQLSTGKV